MTIRIFVLSTLSGLPLLAPTLAQEAESADIVAARRQVMATIGTQMAPIQYAVADQAGELEDLKARAEAIAGLLAAFPHLFPATTDTEAGDLDSDASPAIWKDFAAFSAFAHASLEAANTAAMVPDLPAMLTAGATLDQTCTDCHAQFLEYSMPDFGGAGDADALKGLGF